MTIKQIVHDTIHDDEVVSQWAHQDNDTTKVIKSKVKEECFQTVFDSWRIDLKLTHFTVADVKK